MLFIIFFYANFMRRFFATLFSLIFIVSAALNIPRSQAAVFNPQGQWSLTAPATAFAFSVQNPNNSVGGMGNITLANFTDALVISANQVIEYQSNPAIAFVVDGSQITSVFLNSAQSGEAWLDDQSEPISGYDCSLLKKTSLKLTFTDSNNATFKFGQRFELVPTNDPLGCEEFGLDLKQQLTSGTAPSLWTDLNNAGILNLASLEKLKYVIASYSYSAVKTSSQIPPTPACPPNQAPFLTETITDTNQLSGIVPLGSLNPQSGHVFPTDHVYFTLKTNGPMNDPNSPRVVAPVIAPGQFHITKVDQTSYYKNGLLTDTDYSIYFRPCFEVSAYLHHVRSLDPNFSSLVGSITDQCQSYTTGNTQIQRCSKNLYLPVEAGTVLGSAGGAPTPTGFDLGMTDSRVTLNFINPTNLGGIVHTVCPIDAFVDPVRQSLESFLGSGDGLFKRTTPPICGQIDVDVAGTAQGRWLNPGSNTFPEDPHLALAPNNLDPAVMVFSVGNSLPGLAKGAYSFLPGAPGSTVNQAFSSITPGTLYCFENLGGNKNSVSIPVLNLGKIILVELTDPTHLNIAVVTGNSCSGAPATMPLTAKTYVR